MTALRESRIQHTITLMVMIAWAILPAQGEDASSGAAPYEKRPTKSRWLSEYGARPTYQDYVEEHPYRPFWGQRVYRTSRKDPILSSTIQATSSDVSTKFGIFVNSALYRQLSGPIALYVADLEASGWQVVLYIAEGGLPQDLKELITQEYSEGLVGCILIGEFPVAWYEDEAGAGE